MGYNAVPAIPLYLAGCCAASVYCRLILIRSQIGTNHLGQGQRHQEGKMEKVTVMGLNECLPLVHKDFVVSRSSSMTSHFHFNMITYKFYVIAGDGSCLLFKDKPTLELESKPV